jgi:hypothetical protein
LAFWQPAAQHATQPWVAISSAVACHSEGLIWGGRPDLQGDQLLYCKMQKAMPFEGI